MESINGVNLFGRDGQISEMNFEWDDQFLKGLYGKDLHGQYHHELEYIIDIEKLKPLIEQSLPAEYNLCIEQQEKEYGHPLYYLRLLKPISEKEFMIQEIIVIEDRLIRFTRPVTKQHWLLKAILYDVLIQKRRQIQQLFYRTRLGDVPEGVHKELLHKLLNSYVQAKSAYTKVYKKGRV